MHIIGIGEGRKFALKTGGGCMDTRRKLGAVSCVVVFLSFSVSEAQVTTGTIMGTVADTDDDSFPRDSVRLEGGFLEGNLGHT